MPLRRDVEKQRLEEREDTRYQSFRVKKKVKKTTDLAGKRYAPLLFASAFDTNEISYRRVPLEWWV